MHPEDQGRIELGLARQAERGAARSAVIDGARTWSYGEIEDAARRNATRLRDAGLQPGDRACIYLDKSIESVLALYAVWMAGGIAVPAHEGLRARQLGHLLADSGAALLVSTVRRLARLEAGLPEGVGLFEIDLDAPRARLDGALPGGRTPAAILYTSGSTGRPKGIVVSHGNLIAGARIVSGYLGLRPEDRTISILPFSFDYGLNQLLTAVRTGGVLCLQRSHFPPDICRTLSSHRVTVMAGVPALWIQLLDRLSPFPSMAFPDLRTLTNSGGAFPVELVARYRALLPQARIFLMYGLSEAFRSTYLDPALVDVRPGSIGKAIPECEVLLVTEGPAGPRPCTPGEPGELVHVGPTVALGYWRNPEATAERFRPHPFAPDSGETVVFSGDLVRADAEGFLYFVGRRDQMIKTQGYRVSPEEVEEVLYASGLVREAAVRGEPDPVLGQAIVAHVVPADPGSFSSEALLGFCRRELPGYLVPRAVRLHAELPHTGSGKVDRRGLAS